jgi:hypothetical protein
MVWSSSDLSKSSEKKEEKNLDHVNIPQKPIVKKRMENELNEAWEARLYHKAYEIRQVAKEVQCRQSLKQNEPRL